MFDWIKGRSSKNRKEYGHFNFHLRSTPQIIDTSSTLSLIAYSNAFGNATIPCIYHWAIIKNGVKVQRPEFKGSTFRCEPSDVGAIIEVQVRSTDQQYGGTAIVQFDPVIIDPHVKTQVDSALTCGHFQTTAHIVQGIQQRQCLIKISQEMVVIKHNYSQASYSFRYTLNEPETQCLTKTQTSIKINFNKKYHPELKNFIGTLFDDPFKNIPFNKTYNSQKDIENEKQYQSIQLKFPNHSMRDIFLFVWKDLSVYNQHRNATKTCKSEMKIMMNHNENIGYLTQTQNLKNQLIRMNQTLNKSQKQKLQYVEEIKRLKMQINSIIRNYKIFIEQNFHQKTQYLNGCILIKQQNKNNSINYQNLQNENYHLNSRIQALTEQIDTIRFQPLKLQSQIVVSGLKKTVHPIYNMTNSYHQNNGKSINGTPFSKKKTRDQSQEFGGILDDLDTSRISYISQVSSIYQILDKNQKSKHRQDGLGQSSNDQVSLNHSKFYQRQQQITKNVKFMINPQKSNQNSINFMYKNNNSNNLAQNNCQIQSSQYHKTLNQNNHKKIALNDLRQIKKMNYYSNNLQEQYHKPQQRNIYRSNSIYELNASVKTQKKQVCFRQDNNQELNSILMKNQGEINKIKKANQQLLKERQSLIRQNQTLLREKNSLLLELQQSKKTQSQVKKLQAKIVSLQSQIQFYQKNLDAVNRSQQLSIDSTTFNEEQIQILKKQNEFLTNQNLKLSRACQKLMKQAKQSNILRLQLTKIRSRIASQNLT